MVADAATHKSGQVPKPGDFSVCIQCATVLCFSEGLNLRRAESTELAHLRRTQPSDYEALEFYRRKILARN